jgi:hypothetical protein
MKTTKSEMDALRRHEANAKVYEHTMLEIVKTMRSLEVELHGEDKEKAAWAEGWIACAVTMAKALKETKPSAVRSLRDDGFPF